MPVLDACKLSRRGGFVGKFVVELRRHDRPKCAPASADFGLLRAFQSPSSGVTLVSAKLSELLGLLDLEQIDSDIFPHLIPAAEQTFIWRPDNGSSPYGGNSHGRSPAFCAFSARLFLRPGDPSVAAIIRIERTRDGGSFSTRRVLVTQRGETIFSMDASFQVQQPGLSHQLSMPDLSPPQPEKIPPALMDAAFVTWRHEFRRLQSETPQPPKQFVWFKVTADVPIDPAAPPISL